MRHHATRSSRCAAHASSGAPATHDCHASPCSRSASARPARSSASSTACCCARCPTRTPNGIVRSARDRPGPAQRVSTANFLDWQRCRTTSSSAMAAVNGTPSTLSEAGGADADQRRARVGRLLRRLRGRMPALGRTFAAGEDTAGHAIASSCSADALWQSAFGADRSIVGRTSRSTDSAYTVIGVLAAGSAVRSRPRRRSGGRSPSRPGERRATTTGSSVIARLKPGVTIEQARRGMDADRRAHRARIPGNQQGLGHHDRSVRRHRRRASTLRQSLNVLMGAVGMLLLARLRESRQPLAGARHRPRARGARARRAGREPSSNRSTVPHREPVCSLAGGALGVAWATA